MFPLPAERIAARLRDVRVYEDAATTVYARARLSPPSRPVALCTRGWLDKCVRRGHPACRLAETSRLIAYSPEPGRDLSLALDLKSTLGPCTVRLRRGDDEMARWVVRPGDVATHRSGPFRVGAGLDELTIETVPGAECPARSGSPVASERTPSDVWITRLALEPSSGAGAPPPTDSIARRER
jgi:hypothetical protein